MRKFYLFVLSLVFATLSVFAQFTNKPEVKATFEPDAAVWVKVCFLDANYPDEMKVLTDNRGNGFKAQNEMPDDNSSQLFQLIGSDLSSFQLVSKNGYYLYLKNNAYVEGATTPKLGDYNLKLTPVQASDKQGYKGIATKSLKFADVNKALVPKYAIEWEGYIEAYDSNDGVVVVFKVVGGEAPPSDPAPEGEPQEKTYKLSKAKIGNGTFKICKRGETEEITDLTAIEDGTDIDIICEPASGYVLKQINGGDLFGNAWDYSTTPFDEENGQALTYSPTVAVTKNATISVTFVQKVVPVVKYNVTILPADLSAGGSLTLQNGSTSGSFDANSLITLQSNVSSGYKLKEVLVNNVNIYTGTLPVSFRLTQAMTVKPVFELISSGGGSSTTTTNITIQYPNYQADVSIVGESQTPITLSDTQKLWSLEVGKEYTLDITPKAGWEFDYLWDNRYIQDRTAKFTASEDNNLITLHFKEKTYPVKLYTPVEGGAIQIINHWAETAKLGQEMQLKAFPEAGYTLKHVKVRGEDITSSMKFLIAEDNAIEALFVKKTTGTLKEFNGEGGKVTFDGHSDEDEVNLGDEVMLIVTPNKGYELVTLKVGGEDVMNTKKFNVKVDNTIEAVFQKKTYILSVPNVAGGKLKLKDVSEGELVEYGKAITIEVEPETGYELATLTAGGENIKDTKILVVSEDNEIKASFAKKKYELTLPTSDKGTLEFEGLGDDNKAEFGQEVTIKVLPNKGFMLKKLEAGGQDITDTKKFIVGENNEIVVSFTEKLYTLVAPEVEGGRIQFLGIEEGAQLKLGTKVRVRVIPAMGHVLAKLTVGGQDITADRILTVGENNEVVVVFRKATALDEIEGFSFALYPNPATDYIVLEGLAVNAQVLVLDLTGKAVITAEADFAGSLRLNVSHLPKGLYLVRSGKAIVKLQIR